jgi:hypothetical protein
VSFTTTTNYNLTKPDVNSENGVWGTEINANSDALDALIKSLDNRIAALEAKQANLTWQ